MTQPGTPQPRPPYPWVPPAARQPMRTWDVVLAVVLYGVAVILGPAAAYFTVFFAFATDPCGPDDCRTGYLGWAFVVSWGGTAFAIVGATVMLIVAAVRRWYLWYWPVLAIVLTVASFGGGLALASQVHPGA
ncbi:hypothetical protein ACRS6B_06265 [Nocardia asteroides]